MLRKGILGIGTVFVVVAMLLATSIHAENTATVPRKTIVITPSETLITGDSLVAGSELDEKKPVIETDKNGNLLVAYTLERGVFDTDILISTSTNGGETWNSVTPPWGEELEGRQDNAELCFDPNVNVLLGTFADEAYPALMIFKVDDVSDLGTYEYNGWGGPDELVDAGITYTTLEDGTELIVTMGTGSVSPFESTCVWGYMSVDPFEFYGGYYYYDAQSVIGEYTDAREIKGFTFGERTYGFIFYALVGETGKYGIGIKWTLYENEPDLEYVANQFWLEDGSGDYHVIAPDVATSGNSIYVVYCTDENIYGNYGVYMKYTTDGGQTWNRVTVVDDPTADDLYPAIYAAGNTLYVVYVKSGNLYLVKSTDGGQTWSEPEQVNEVDGTVSMEEHTADICSRGIVWVDTRNGNKDIYFAPLPAPIITIGISGGFGVKATISNEGTEAAENLDWSVDLSGAVFIGKHAEGTIDTLNPGDSVTVGPGLVFGIGPTTITVNAGGVTKTASGFVLGPLVLGVS